jgi:hypothetical protein
VAVIGKTQELDTKRDVIHQMKNWEIIGLTDTTEWNILMTKASDIQLFYFASMDSLKPYNWSVITGSTILIAIESKTSSLEPDMGLVKEKLESYYPDRTIMTHSSLNEHIKAVRGVVIYFNDKKEG